MPQVDAMLDLPYETLALLAAGYLSYRLAYIGRNSSHASVDVVFLTSVFAFIAKLSMLIASVSLPSRPEYMVWLISPVIGLIGAIVAAAVWRTSLQEEVYERLREARISDHDGQPNVWRSMMARNLKSPTRLVVGLKDGTSLMCNKLAAFNDAPMGPCLLGEDGSVAMYVTDICRAGADEWSEVEPYGEEVAAWGYEMSFIPADQIARIDITRPH